LYVFNGKVLEAATSNFFVVKEGTLVTPKDGILFGITRKIVIDEAKKAGLEVEERDVTSLELREANEAFITSSFKDIVPIVKIDEDKVGDGSVGPISRQIMGLFGVVSMV
jgi:branched-subunit amino acid aminotransferase/4-amino-4-deoxychorismate lyase